MPTALTPPAPADAVWRAGNDRIAHAHGPHALRTVCGMEIVQERLAWPAFRRCMVCQAALEQVPETEAPRAPRRPLMTARHAIAVLVILAAGAAVVCVPAAVFLGLGAMVVAIDAMDADRRAARRRTRAWRMR